jgi:hypothetical protein
MYLSAAHAAASSASDPAAKAAAAVFITALLAVIWRLARRPSVTRVVLPRPGNPPTGGGGWKLPLAVAGAGVLGFGYWWDQKHPAGAVKAAASPVPSPTPTPMPTATATTIINRTVTVHAGGHSWPVNGVELVVIVALICVAGYFIVREAGRRFGS